jgi:two-component system, NtrC family, nitrogen regulation response regulator NtrX
MSTVLIVDDEANIRRMLGSLLRAEGYQVREAASARAALLEVREEEPDLMMLDLAMPGGSGLDVLPEISAAAPRLPVVMMSGRASLSDAVRATKLGAFHFLEKPLAPEAVLLALRSALELRQAREVNRSLREQLGEDDPLVGASERMTEVRELIARVAPTEARVLITGESGTGKELAASAIHRLSRRAPGPFIRLNCAAIPRDLVESELFGHEKGAFTGASERRRGRFELADGGTLLLDEIGDLSAEAQAKLLRALEAGEIERVGGDQPIRIDVRIVASTNRDLHADVAAGRFREDLFFRLHVIPVHMPPLRERPGDVRQLVGHFLERHRSRTAMMPPRIGAPAMEALERHPWPGNVRELANIVERLVILHAGAELGAEEVRSVLLGSPTARPTAAALVRGNGAAQNASLTRMLDEFERDLIRAALDQADGSIAEAARRLQTDRANLYRRIRRLDLGR